MNKDEMDEYSIEEEDEEEQEADAVKPEAIEGKSLADLLVDFGTNLANGILENLNRSGQDAPDPEDAAKLREYATLFDNALYIGDMACGIALFDATWIEEVIEHVGSIRIPDSFGKDCLQDLMVKLACIKYQDIALMQTDVRDDVVCYLEDLASRITEDLEDDGYSKL